MRLSYVVCDFKTSIGLFVDEDVPSGVRPAMSFTQLQRSFQNWGEPLFFRDLEVRIGVGIGWPMYLGSPYPRQ